MNQRRKGVLITYIIMILNIVIGVFYTPFMLKKLGEEQYGIYSLASSLMSFITMLDLGFSQTMVRYLSKYRALQDKTAEEKTNGLFLKLYTIIAIIAAIIGVILVIFYPKFCTETMNAYEIKTFRVIFLILLVNVVLSFPLCIFTAILNSYEKFVVLKLMNLFSVILKYGSILIALTYGYKVIAIAIITSIVSVLMQLGYMIYCIKILKIKFSFDRFDDAYMREVFAFSFFIFLNILIDFMYNSTDKLILGAVKGSVAVAVYAIAVQFLIYFQELSTAISGVFMPKVSYLYEYKHDMNEISNLFNRVGRVQMFILSFVLSIFIVFGKQFIYLWVGSSYKDAYIIALLMMIPAIVGLSQNIGITILRVMNLHKYRSYMYLVIALLNVAVSIPLAKEMGGIGAAIGTCGANILGQIIFMNWFYYKKINLDIKMYWMNLIQILMYLGLVIIIWIWIFEIIVINSWLKFIINIVAFSVLYFGGFYILIANSYEKMMLQQLLKIRKRRR